ncbi:MAG TPA: benenodin family lasso peptide [Candidatus Acidoferrales bacterium]|nr:benenodin family lasso peptide [Candidatus Acidoferrales bacterium]
MNTNENIRNDPSEEVIELGIASVETLGGGGTAIESLGHNVLPGLTED